MDVEGCCVCVQDGLHDELAAALTERMSAIRVGDGFDPATQMGPCINRQRVEHATAHVADAVSRGARVACGGGAPDGLATGFFFAPTLLEGATADMRVFREETFAPVVPLMRCAPDGPYRHHCPDQPLPLTSCCRAVLARNPQRLFCISD